MKLYILLLIQLLVTFGNISGFSQKSQSVCYNKSSGVVYEKCCLHFELIDNLCKECEVGYYRITTAKKCKPCPSHQYGKKCASVCNCKENEGCDSINGTCITWTSSIRTFTEHSTNMRSTNYGILVYMICAGLIIMMLCTVAAVYKYHHKNKNVPQGFPKHGVIDSTPPPIVARYMQPSVVLEVGNSGGAYELIDDNNVLELEY
ncbi:MEGF10_11 [Mytilus edulis]|uniref:MEGF10_11 n=1 Tax=Mytilus edulis TaxID=6550 RepID=A0A8S3UDR8_MYTED|nr:MEGF10_11 [Mytilus edulis]